MLCRYDEMLSRRNEMDFFLHDCPFAVRRNEMLPRAVVLSCALLPISGGSRGHLDRFTSFCTVVTVHQCDHYRDHATRDICRNGPHACDAA